MNDENCRAPVAEYQIMYKQLLAQLQTDKVPYTHHQLLLFSELSFCAPSHLFLSVRFYSSPQQLPNG